MGEKIKYKIEGKKETFSLITTTKPLPYDVDNWLQTFKEKM
jgi:hypothetical protein